MFFKTDEPHGLPYHPFKASVIPRPIGWVSTVSADGVGNVAPFSFFNGLAQDPPQVMVSFNGTLQDREGKDTLANMGDTQEFVVNIVTLPLVEAMVMTSKPVAATEDEAILADLEMIDSHLVKAKRIALSPIHMECRLIQTIPLLSDDPSSPNTMAIGHVVGMHIEENVMTGGLIDYDKLQAITRLGYRDYAEIGRRFTVPVPWR